MVYKLGLETYSLLFMAFVPLNPSSPENFDGFLLLALVNSLCLLLTPYELTKQSYWRISLDCK